VSENSILARFVASDRAREIRRLYTSFGPDHQVRLRFPVENDDPDRQGNLIILKAPQSGTNERGALLVKYSEAIEALPAVFSLERLVRQYAVVLEPSWWGYADIRFLYYIGCDARVIVQSPMIADRRFVAGLNANLVPIAVGAGDWVDPDAFVPPPDSDRYWDVVMVSSWSTFKRHDVLFKALRRLRDKGTRLSAALVGYPRDLRLDDVRAIADRFAVRDQCTFFDSVPHSQVSEIVGRSRVSLLLSRQEGANKALYESLFVGTPVLVPADHLGVNVEHVRAVGQLFHDDELDDALVRMTGQSGGAATRTWAMEHTGAPRATQLLNERLRGLALAAGEPWTRDLVPKKNAPNLRYVRQQDSIDLSSKYQELCAFLR